MMSINDLYSDDIITIDDTSNTVTLNVADATNIHNPFFSSNMSSSINDNSTVPYLTINNGTSGTGLNYGTYQYHTNNTAPWVTVNPNTQGTLDVKGDANFEGDIKFKGKSLEELFAKIEDRLAILQPDPAKLEKYEALRKAYDHYKLLEKLIQED